MSMPKSFDPSSTYDLFCFLVQRLVSSPNLFEMVSSTICGYTSSIVNFCGFANFCRCFNESLFCINTFFVVFVIGILDLHKFLDITPSLVVSLALLLKMPLCNLSNTNLVNSSIFANLTIRWIPLVNIFPSSHSNDDGDAKGQIAFNGAML